MNNCSVFWIVIFVTMFSKVLSAQTIYLEEEFKLIYKRVGDTLCYNDFYRSSLINQIIINDLGMPDSIFSIKEDELTGRMYEDYAYEGLGLSIFDDFSMDLTLTASSDYSLMLNSGCEIYISMSLLDLSECFPAEYQISQNNRWDEIGVPLYALFNGKYKPIDRSILIKWDPKILKVNYIGIWDTP